MTEENKIEATEQKPVELSPIEQKAMDSGWVPQDQWEGDPDQWRPAKEFLDRGELFKKIEDQSRTIKEFKKTLDAFSKHHSQVREVEYKRALETLKSQKKAALIDGDADLVVDLDEKIDLIRDEQRELSQSIPEPAQEVHNPVFDNWVEKNSWYTSDRAMRSFADTRGRELHAEGYSPTEVLRMVEVETKKEFAHKFRNPNRDKPGAVESGTNKGTTSKGAYTLSPDERQVMQRFIKTIPGMTEEKYIADLKKIKGE